MIFLCLGNSLTAGYPGYDPSPDGISQGYGNQQSQYEYWLKDFCFNHLEKNLGVLDDEIINNLIFINKGIPGELTRNLLRRINYDLINIKPKPNYSIILGGTNDLGWSIPNESILKNIEELHTISRSFNILSIGGTIPPIRMEQSYDSYNKKKIELNEKLISYFNKNDIPFADLYSSMIDNKGNLSEKFAYIDGLHFSVEGYKQMAKILFNDTIKLILEKKYF
jgi:lysophospholipase L1-like esterase